MVSETTVRVQQFVQDKPFIDWLVRWRMLLGIEIGSTADQTIAYLIDKVYKENPAHWQQMLVSIEKQVLAYSPSARVGFLNRLCLSQEQRDLLTGLQAAKSTKDRQAYEIRIKTTKEGIMFSNQMIEGERDPYWFGANPKVLPRWYYNAREEYSFFEKAYGNLKKPPLAEEFKTVQEIADIESFKKLFQRSAEDLEVYYTVCKPFVEKLEKLIQEEIKLREQMFHELNVNNLPAWGESIKAKIREQLKQWKSFESILNPVLPKISKNVLVQCKDLYNKISSELELHMRA